MTLKDEEEQPWGRLLICGGTHWASNGGKSRNNNASDLTAPHILRALCNVQVVKALTGPAANYAVVFDINGAVRIFGRSPALALGANTNGIISEHAPLKITPASVGLTRGGKFIDGAAGKTHLLLVDNLGGVWGCGNNTLGQIGLPVSNEIEEFTRINAGWPKDTKIIAVSAGNTFSLFLTETGEVYAAGSSEEGQLGNGKTGERIHRAGKVIYDIEHPPKLVQGLKDRKIVKIASGNQHSLALDDEGYVYSWGNNGYCRLGLGDQKARLVPTIVPTFTDTREFRKAERIFCGPTCSVVIDRSKQFYIAGKWKTTGEGSTGAPYTTFKTLQQLTGWKVINASVGGCTFFITTPHADGEIATAGWGQGCLYGELGLGDELGKSSTKPVEIEPLKGIDITDIAAGAFFTLFIARPNANLSDIPRHPEHVDSAAICLECNEDRGADDPPMECEKCDQPYHPECLKPPLDGFPEAEWFCPECEAEMAEEARADQEEQDEVDAAGGRKGEGEEEDDVGNGSGGGSRTGSRGGSRAGSRAAGAAGAAAGAGKTQGRKSVGKRKLSEETGSEVSRKK